MVLPKFISTILLRDNHTAKNLCVVSKNEKKTYNTYCVSKMLTIDDILNGKVMPRCKKCTEDQSARTADSAEVFTNNTLVHYPISLFEEEWFGEPDVFTSTHSDFSYTSSTGKIKFPTGRTWRDYISFRFLEPFCGEGSHLVTRYNIHNNKIIPVQQRCGVLDHKMRVINENAPNPKVWIDSAMMAIQTTYAFDLQGDNVFLTRYNIIMSLIDYYKARFGSESNISHNDMSQFAHILSYNIIQMDMDTFCVPHEPDNLCEFVNWHTETTLPVKNLVMLK